MNEDTLEPENRDYREGLRKEHTEPREPQQPAVQSDVPHPHHATSLWESAGDSNATQPLPQSNEPRLQSGVSEYAYVEKPASGGGMPSSGASAAHATAFPTAEQQFVGGGAQPPSFTVPTAPINAAPFQVDAAPAPKKSKGGPGWVAVISMSVAAALIGGVIGMSGSQALQPSASGLVSAPQAGTQVAPVVESKGDAPNWQAVQRAVGNAVVAIDTQMTRGSSAGSGVIVDSQGHVLTNNHVIAGGTNIYVTLADGRLFKAKVAGADAATDLAVLTIDNPPKNLTVATLGDSSNLHVGQDVAAIGNPLGLSSTMTTGIISALNRPVSTRESQGQQGQQLPFGQAQQSPQVVTNAIQIDAAVNPGNSGGPVFDSAGRVIGIASSIASLSGASGEAGSIGLGFAIPINLAKQISQQLIKNGVAEHAFLGVTISDGAAQYNGENRLGAEVQSVSAGTPAAQAGIQKGDVIIRIAGNDVPNARSLTGFVRQYQSGDKVKLTLERDGKLLDATVVLATRKDSAN
ncbi:MAG: trypsin-like peptidase domain-containing protein [Arcanobacterium sp.]|nr:trypsin-like peptidase domain-containing protein [Arcanobacterium sp.]